MFELAQDFREVRADAGPTGFGGLLWVSGITASPGRHHKSLVAKDSESLLHSGRRDVETVRQIPHGADLVAGLDDSIPDLASQGLGCLFVGLSGVVLSDRHASERTH